MTDVCQRRVRRLASGMLVLLMMLGGGCAAERTHQQTTAGLIDRFDFAVPSEAGLIEASGDVATAVVGDFVGSHDERRPARVLRGEGSSIAFRMRVHPQAVTTLEFEEIYGRDREVRGYWILIDGRRHYFRTFRGCGAGPVHYFVQVPPTGKTSVNVQIVNRLDAPVSLSRVWAFADLERYVRENELEVPFYLAPTVHLSWTDFAADLAKLRQIRDSLGQHPTAKPAWTTWIGYANLSDRQLADRIDYVLRLANESSLPVQLAFDTWWAHTPMGPDGRGGTWRDETYQQLVYNATRKTYQRSVPNRWANTPWLTMNHSDLNAFKQQRLTAAMSILAERYRTLLAQGKQQAILAINLDNEPVYWASGNAGLGSDLLWADFNSATVADARRDEVRLDPTDGLDRSERRWLWTNLLRYQEMIATTAATSLGRDATVVGAAGVTPPADLLRHNLYTQAMAADPELQYPMFDRAYPLWENGAPRDARVGGEWNRDSTGEIEAVLHQIALGRNAAVNAECGNDPTNMLAVRPAYALGQRYCALYNYPPDRMEMAGSQIRDVSSPFSPAVYLPEILESRFADEAWTKQVVSHDGLQTRVIGNTAAMAICPASNAKAGYLTYRLDGVTAGLVLELSGRAFVHGRSDSKVRLRILAGESEDPASMREIAALHDQEDINAVHRIDLSDAARGRSNLYVRIELHAPNLPAEVLDWCSIHRVRFAKPWPASKMQGLPRQDESLATLRRQNLIVSWRADAEGAIAELTARSDEVAALVPKLSAARQAYDRAAYATAYRLANEGLALSLPATFYLKKSGRLEPYPIAITTPAPLTCTIIACDADQIRLAFSVDKPVDIAVHPTGLPANREYSVVRQSGHWLIRPASPSDLPGTRRFTGGQDVKLTVRP